MNAANVAFTRGGTNRYIHYDGANGSIGFLSTAGGWSLRVDNSGSAIASNELIANGAVKSGNGSGILHTDGNVQGSVWGGFLSNYVYSTADARGAAQGQAWANDRVANLQYRLASEGLINYSYGSGASGSQRAPSGAVLSGIEYANSNTAPKFYYRYPQVYDPVRGWVGFNNA